MTMPIFELSSKKHKNGRRPFKASLYELQPPECVVDDVGTKYNKNGITFLEEYASQTLESIKDMSVRVEFIDDERTMILAHGDTGVSDDGLPLFNNATTIGHFTKGYIADITLNGETKRCVCGDGYLDEMAYQPFIQSLETQLNNGNSVDGSIEIYRTDNNDAIVYKKGWLEKGRIPTEYIHSGWDMVINPADTSSTLLELNNSETNKEDKTLDEKELKELIQSTISETNSKNEELLAKITELNSTINEKDSVIAEKEEKIVELNATVEQVQKALDDLKKEHETYWSEREALEKELGTLKAKARIGELNTAIEGFSDEEKKYAESEINSFNEKPLEGNIDAIVDKIYAGIGQASKKADAEAKVAEQNSAKENKDNEVIDIFSEMCSETQDNEEEDVNIF
jgi:uncharacterized coiled-coil protein SlyX